MGRVRVYDAAELARSIRTTFADRPVEYEVTLPFEWPAKLHNIGDSLGVAYGSDKWKNLDESGKREIELYCHLAESRNRVLVTKGLLAYEDDPDRAYPTVGPMVSLASLPMPKHFAVLGLFTEARLCLYETADYKSNPPRYEFGDHEDDGVVAVELRHAYLGASKILWSKRRRGAPDQPFIFAYTEDDGIQMMIVGEKLDIEKDGIVG